MSNNNNADVFQLDSFNYDSGQYECVEVRSNSNELSECAALLGLKCFRIWNRSHRAEQDRMLPPVPRVVQTTNHARRFSLVHRPLKKDPTEYGSYTA